MGGGGRGLVRKEGFRRILKKPWSLRQLMRFNLDFKSTMKSTLNSKNSSCIFWGQPRFQENSNFSPVNNNSNVSLVRSEEDVNIIISNDPHVTPSECRRVLIVRVKIFKYQCCIFSQKCCGVPWFVLLLKSRLCKWEVTLSSPRLMMMSWASERMKIWHSTFPEPYAFLLIQSSTSFLFTNFNPLPWRSLSLILLKSIKKSESVSSVKVCCIYRAVFLTKSSEDTDALIDDCV